MKSTFFYATATAVGFLFSVSVAQAGKIELSSAFDYNAFIFENFEGRYSDVEGRLAVAGDMTVNDFNVGLLLSPDLSSSSLAVGGNLDFTRGNVHGGDTTVSNSIVANNVMFDKAVNAEQDVTLTQSTVQSGGISSNGKTTLNDSNIAQGDIRSNQIVLTGNKPNSEEYGSSVDDGSLVAQSDVSLTKSRVNGSVSAGGTITATDSDVSGDIQQNVSTQTTEFKNIDFDNMINEVTAQSADFAERTINGKTTLTCGDKDCTNPAQTINEIKFSGTDDINFYSVSADWFSAKDKQITYDFSTTSYNIINVFGDSVELFNTGFFNAAFTEENEYFKEQGQYKDNNNDVGRRHDGRYTNNILFNFVDALDIDFYSVGIKGSVLAPFADVNFYEGHIDGNLIAKSLSSPNETRTNDKGEVYTLPTGQVNNYKFGAIDVNEPASVAILFGAGFLLLSRRRQRVSLA
ncbi:MULTISPECIES: choice-of-anchor A family protein [unclassified Alteromonas]|uniref:choice-of-anchor A family protein n=1 Tax=unclassified Alteromonas TaxID=2614992 RepID=UPI00068B2FF1|nr:MULTISPECIES: choice-of-anchor A family protein [unclassified Alteromonas]